MDELRDKIENIIYEIINENKTLDIDLQGVINYKLDKLFDSEDKGNISDGYHTFNELYYHRMILFSVICNQNRDLAWKSRLHEDGTMFDNYFIVGIKTPDGQYTYHYDLKYWDMFKVKVLDFAPKWDGHKPEDITRLLSLRW